MKLFESGIFYIHQRKTGDTVDLLTEKKKRFWNLRKQFNKCKCKC